jgi:hypothetical protein
MAASGAAPVGASSRQGCRGVGRPGAGRRAGGGCGLWHRRAEALILLRIRDAAARATGASGGGPACSPPSAPRPATALPSSRPRRPRRRCGLPSTALHCRRPGRRRARRVLTLARAGCHGSRRVAVPPNVTLVPPPYAPELVWGCSCRALDVATPAGLGRSGAYSPVGNGRATIRREFALSRVTAPQPCIRRVARIRTTIRPCASAAKLRGGGPILNAAQGPCSGSGCRHLGPFPAARR